MKIYTMSEMASEGKSPEVLFWVGCAGSFDTRAQRVTKAFCEILNRAGISFAVLEMKNVVQAILQEGRATSFCFR
ncbi:hypothetical protein MASR1M65_14340 [Saprospiraceae bacterium]